MPSLFRKTQPKRVGSCIVLCIVAPQFQFDGLTVTLSDLCHVAVLHVGLLDHEVHLQIVAQGHVGTDDSDPIDGLDHSAADITLGILVFVSAGSSLGRDDFATFASDGGGVGLVSVENAGGGGVQMLTDLRHIVAAAVAQRIGIGLS